MRLRNKHPKGHGPRLLRVRKPHHKIHKNPETEHRITMGEITARKFQSTVGDGLALLRGRHRDPKHRDEWG